MRLPWDQQLDVTESTPVTWQAVVLLPSLHRYLSPDRLLSGTQGVVDLALYDTGEGRHCSRQLIVIAIRISLCRVYNLFVIHLVSVQLLVFAPQSLVST